MKVAFARNQVEAEMIQGLLSEAGIPSILKRSRGFDAPEFLAAGPHDIFVASNSAQRATDVLANTLIESEDEGPAESRGEARPRGGSTSASRLALWVLAAAFAALILVWLLYELS